MHSGMAVGLVAFFGKDLVRLSNSVTLRHGTESAGRK